MRGELTMAAFSGAASGTLITSSRNRAVFGRPGALPVCHVHVGVLVVVGAVSAPASQWRLARRPEVRVDPLLELGGYLRVVAEAGTLFDGGFV